jgi:beta-glucosidase
VLRVKFKLGCFENPYAPELPREKTCILPDADELSLKFARETMVLLKNNKKLLPLDSKKFRRIALIGPSANEIHPHLGQWRAAAEPTPEYGETLLDAAKKFFPKAEISFARGCAGWDYRTNPSDAAECEKAVAVAKEADIVLLCFGELPWMAGEIKSRRDICLPSGQRELIKALSALNKPIIGLCCSGRALAFQEEAEAMDALLWLWQSGRRAPTAAMEILTGKVNPSGKLPITFPRSVGQIPIYYNCHGKITPEAHDYQDLQDEDGPWFPFGYGLAYSTYKYGKLKIKKTANGLEAHVSVKNTGKYDGKETVIWYLSDIEAKFTQPVRRVIAFDKLSIKAGETKDVCLKIDPKRDLAYSLPNGIKILEPGEFVLSASRQSEASFWFDE